MNQKLANKLQAPMTADNRREILHLVAEAAPEASEIADIIKNVETVQHVIDIAASYVNSATAKLSRERIDWTTLIGTTEIAVALQELLKNPSLVNYTQAVMLVTVALMKEETTHEPR